MWLVWRKVSGFRLRKIAWGDFAVLCGALTGPLRTAKAGTTCSFYGKVWLIFRGKWAFLTGLVKFGQDRPKCVLHGHILVPGQNWWFWSVPVKFWPGTLFWTGSDQFWLILVDGQKWPKMGHFWGIFQQGSGLGHGRILRSVLTSKFGKCSGTLFLGESG